MPEENFRDNLLRAVAAELHFLNRVTAAREMFAQSYFSLGMVEKATVDQTVMSMVAGTYQSFTPEALGLAQQQLRQLGDGRRDCSRLILSHEIARVYELRREVDIRHSETVGVADDVCEVAIVLDGPGRREAASGWHQRFIDFECRL